MNNRTLHSHERVFVKYFGKSCISELEVMYWVFLQRGKLTDGHKGSIKQFFKKKTRADNIEDKDWFLMGYDILVEIYQHQVLEIVHVPKLIQKGFRNTFFMFRKPINVEMSKCLTLVLYEN